MSQLTFWLLASLLLVLAGLGLAYRAYRAFRRRIEHE